GTRSGRGGRLRGAWGLRVGWGGWRLANGEAQDSAIVTVIPTEAPPRMPSRAKHPAGVRSRGICTYWALDVQIPRLPLAALGVARDDRVRGTIHQSPILVPACGKPVRCRTLRPSTFFRNARTRPCCTRA